MVTLLHLQIHFKDRSGFFWVTSFILAGNADRFPPVPRRMSWLSRTSMSFKLHWTFVYLYVWTLWYYTALQVPFPKVCHFQSCVNLALSSRLLPPYSVFHFPVVIVPFLWVRLYNSIFNVWLIFCRHQNVYLLWFSLWYKFHCKYVRCGTFTTTEGSGEI